MEFNPENMYRFLAEIEATVDKRMNRAIAGAVSDLAWGLIEKTPVKTGLLRGSWQVSFDQPAYVVQSKDPTGAATLARIQEQMFNYDVEKNQSIFLTNSAQNEHGQNYLYWIEFGSARNRAHPFVRTEYAKFPELLTRNVQSVAEER